VLSLTDGQLAAWFAAYFWPFVRILALFSAAPLLYHRAIPVRVKIGLAALVTLALAPALPAPQSADAAWLLAQQLVVGLAIGLAVQIAFAAFEIAGDVIGLQMGLGFAGFIDPQNADQTPLIGSFLGLVATLVFLAINGHLLMLAGIAESFRSVPVGAPVPGAQDIQGLVMLGAGMFKVGLHLALPVLATMLIVNLALGVLARAAPQLNIFAVGFPATILIGMLALVLAMPLLGPFVETALELGLAAAFSFGR
jgi:flagellar biosynthetic protein FliR